MTSRKPKCYYGQIKCTPKKGGVIKADFSGEYWVWWLNTKDKNRIPLVSNYTTTVFNLHLFNTRGKPVSGIINYIITESIF